MRPPMPRLAELLLGSDDMEGVRSMGCEDACEPAVDAGIDCMPVVAEGPRCTTALLCSSPCVLAGAEAVAAGMTAFGAGGAGCSCLPALLEASSLCCIACPV